MRYFWGLIAALFVTSAATAGDFIVTEEDSSSISVWYIGEVFRHDATKWLDIREQANGRLIILTIDSYGGSAYGGFDLYWEIEKDRVVTIAGKWQGAWSAAAIMWMAGDERIVPEHSAVGWHRAFCNWDPDPCPEIGCEVRECDMEMLLIFMDAGYSPIFSDWLIAIQWRNGTDGWIEVHGDSSWWITDNNEDSRIPMHPDRLGVPEADWTVNL